MDFVLLRESSNRVGMALATLRLQFAGILIRNFLSKNNFGTFLTPRELCCARFAGSPGVDDHGRGWLCVVRMGDSATSWEECSAICASLSCRMEGRTEERAHALIQDVRNCASWGGSG